LIAHYSISTSKSGTDGSTASERTPPGALCFSKIGDGLPPGLHVNISRRKMNSYFGNAASDRRPDDYYSHSQAETGKRRLKNLRKIDSLIVDLVSTIGQKNSALHPGAAMVARRLSANSRRPRQ
jgi:hypothetical protein